ncbi:MAG: Rrf2 family transcriptional regulator [Eubacterium sp.]|nr:Rrf2 family transcriptional regulator [Eubacterium sp.]
MFITTKGSYALRVMVELAIYGGEDYVPLKEIASRQEISQKYLESIMSILSKGKLVEAASGKGGGYRLTRKPEEYKVGEIFRLTEGQLSPVSCHAMDGKGCDNSANCVTLPFWQGLSDTINDYLDNHTLDEVISKNI